MYIDAEMKKVVVAAFLLSLLLIPLLAKAQPQPPNAPTLGPPTFYSVGDNAANVKIHSPQNQSYSNNQIQLNFSAASVGMFGQFGNVGYSLDGGIIKSVTNFVNKTVDNTNTPDWYWNRTTVFASVVLPTLPEGVHNATVYYGWQYSGTNPSWERYEVYAYATVDFAVGKPTIMPPTIVISSPKNNLTTEANSIPLIFNISAPVAVYAMQSQLRYAYYEVDWSSEKQYLYFQNLSSNEHFQSLQLNTTLSNIPNGTHKLLIVVGGSVTIKQAMFVEEFDSESNSTIIFNVNSATQPTSNLQTQIISIVALASVVVVVIGLLVYFGRHKSKVE